MLFRIFLKLNKYILSFKSNLILNSKITFLYDFFKYFSKKYLYTINHKRIAINYFIFCLWSGLAGTVLATLIRLELAVPGSFVFKYDSIRYLQVITAHGLTMIFFVVIPLVFGAFANFLIPYHIGSKDVAFPRLNSLGFWLLPSGYVLLAKPAFLRSTFAKQYDVQNHFYKLLRWNDKSNFKIKMRKRVLTSSSIDFDMTNNFKQFSFMKDVYNVDTQKMVLTNIVFDKNLSISKKSFFFNNLIQSSDSIWRTIINAVPIHRKKKYQSKCSNAILTMSGWTFITPFSSKLKFTGAGAQDIAIISVILSGVSTTISFTNLLITRRTLSAPGLRNRRVLLPFLSITLFLVMRMLALITPVLGAAMIMLLLDRHWKTTFFDYAYGGDIVLFNHLFWFFGHPEVYVVIIPAFGIVNMLLPYYNTRRVASKHHLIWATYIMGYMGFFSLRTSYVFSRFRSQESFFI